MDGKNRDLQVANFRGFKTWILNRYRKRQGMESTTTFRHLDWVGKPINDKGNLEKETICVGEEEWGIGGW